MGQLDGRVAFITGGARGLGRSHARLLAEHGADVIALDLCAEIDSVDYHLPTPADLDETVRLVEDAGRRAVAVQADVRRLDQVEAALAQGLEACGGRLDIVVANAGIGPAHDDPAHPDRAWQTVIDINLTGTWNTVWAAKQAVIDGGRGGSIVLTSSTAGLKGAAAGTAGGNAYIASKHGVVGLMRSFANELGPHSIRVNSIHPTAADTDLLVDNHTPAPGGPGQAPKPKPDRRAQHALPVDVIAPIDVSNAVLWLVSDAARYVTGITLPVDAGYVVH